MRSSLPRTLAGLALLAGAALFAAVTPSRAQSTNGYLEDARTIRGVSLVAPRGALAPAIAELSRVSEVKLTISADLGRQSLVAVVPRRALRETMSALAELYEADWVTLPGSSPAAYELRPRPQAVKQQQQARQRLIQRTVRALDQAARAEPKEKVERRDHIKRSRALALRAWVKLSATDKQQVLTGTQVTMSLPAQKAMDLAELLNPGELDPSTIKITGPLRVDVDLHDLADTASPSLRVRVIAPVATGFIGEQARFDFVRLVEAPQPKRPATDQSEPKLPDTLGEDGYYSGLRDEILMEFGRDAKVPMLSRHRAYGGGAGFRAGGRRLSAALYDLGRMLDADPELNVRGFALFRSRTAAWDLLGLTPEGPVKQVVAARPKIDEPFALDQVIPLAALTPFQLGVLSRGNIVPEVADYVREAYGPCRFYRALSEDQRLALTSKAGLSLEGLPVELMQFLFEDSAHRGDLRVQRASSKIKGLRMRYDEVIQDGDLTSLWTVFRANTVVTDTAIPLPLAEEVALPRAER